MLRAASWLLAVIGLSWSGINAVDGWMANRERGQLAAKRELVANRYTQLTQELPVQPEQARAMREATALADRLERHPLQTGKLFKLLGKAFSRYPSLEMHKLTWFSSDKADTSKGDSLTALNNASGLPLLRYNVMLVSGALRNFDGSYKNAQQQVDTLARWLRQQPGVVSAEIERAPLDTRPGSQIQGELDSPSVQNSAAFDLRVVMELQNDAV